MRYLKFCTQQVQIKLRLGRLEIESREGGAWKQNAILCLELVGFNFSPVPGPFIVCRDLPKKDPRIIWFVLVDCSAAECVAELWFKQCQTRLVKRPCPAWRTLMCPCTEECKGGIYQFGLLEGGDLVAPVSSLPTRSVRSRPASAKVSCIYFLLPAPPDHIVAHWWTNFCPWMPICWHHVDISASAKVRYINFLCPLLLPTPDYIHNGTMDV